MQRQLVQRKQEDGAVQQKELVRQMTRLVMRDVDDYDDTSTSYTANDRTGKNNHATNIRQHQHISKWLQYRN